ncbi:MAG: High-affinity branched-chain amino acid transport ATP-binding protein LivF [Syntrophorhabdaceae bacterium PtaU1.Bin034]|jgi:branched-chain amino acid transport system ATP-binding protein|nr:MAG: High-affinity branched-chain amino acid transport ATP-binding protein LivF [Syntrophorhabdaceae bacterium PtaU1.Bin034]
MLEVHDLQVHYGRVQALKGVSLTINQGEIVVVIGPNGAGKSTTLKGIMGLVRPSSGRVLLDGVEITGRKAYDLTKKGITLVPEGRQIFPDLSVYENLYLGGYHRLRKGEKKAVEADIDRCFDLFPILADRRRQLAGTLSGGEQQMLAISRGLASAPKLILMDEPSLGLAPITAREIFNVLKRLNSDEGKTILLVEQLAWLGLDICHRGYVLEQGSITIQGTKEELLANSQVIESYVGKRAG